jgi:hypothetical protein
MTKRARISEKLASTEGEEWIRKTARAAAVPDLWHGLRRSMVNPKAWHLFA